MTTAAATDVPPPTYTPPPHARFNFAALVGDVSCFMIGMAFLDASTALPALVERLGGSQTFLGVVLALRQGGYFLPPLFVAHALQGRARYKPFLVTVCLFGRLCLFATPFAVWRYGESAPGIALGVLAAALALSQLGDGAGSVPWTALIGRAIPPRRRGALFATSQVISAVGRLLVGGVVLWLLGSGRVGFPANGALLALGCALLLFISWLFLASLREPPPTEEEAALAAAYPREPLGAYLRSLPGRMRARPEFARLALAQILAGAAPASAPFIVAYAGHETNAAPLLSRLPSAVASVFELLQTGGLPGLFLIVQTLGLTLLAPVWGWLTDRRGPRAALRGVFAVALLSPICALAAGKMPGAGGPLLLFLAAYFCFGAVQDGWVTLTNMLLEMVPESEQPTYIALMNAASIPVLLLPFVCGLLAERAGAPAAFVFAVALLGVGLWVASGLPNTRHPRPRPPLPKKGEGVPISAGLRRRMKGR